MDLDTGNAAWMDAASGVEIRRIRTAGHGAVGVSGDEQLLFLGSPGGKPCFRLFLFRIIAGGTGRVGDADCFQGFPEIPNQKAGQGRQGTVQEVRLVTVGQIDFPLGNAVAEDKAGEKTEIRQQPGRGFRFGIRRCILAAESRAVPAAVAHIFFTVVMVPVEHVEPVLAMKFPEQAEHVVVNVYDPGKRMIFPQLIAVSQFQISITLLKIMLERRKVQVLVFQEIVIGVAHTPMTVTEQDKTRAAVQRDHRGVAKCPGNPLIPPHQRYLLCFRNRLGQMVLRNANGR